MKFKLLYTLFLSSVFIVNCTYADDYKAKLALIAPTIDGNENDVCWNTAPWSPINQVWDPQNATAGTAADFTGHYKAVWTSDKLYVLMRITDDKLTFWNENKDPLVNYYKTDCPELFIDENHSKGNHQCNYNAFAYHISMIYKVVDSDVNCNSQLFNDVLTGARVKIGNTYYWEFAINVYTDAYKLGASNNPKATLYEGKIMGFSAAYNDSDDSWERERMYGSQVISPPDPTYGTNVSYINANYFGTMELVAADITTSFEVNETLPAGINIYPNPASDRIFIESKDVYKILMSDLTGNIIYQNLNPLEHDVIDLTIFKPGIYSLIIQTEKISVNRKVMVK